MQHNEIKMVKVMFHSMLSNNNYNRIINHLFIRIKGVIINFIHGRQQIISLFLLLLILRPNPIARPLVTRLFKALRKI